MISVLFIPEKKEAIICRAGHNPLYIKRSKANRIDVIQTAGPGLGLVKGEEFNKKIKEVTVQYNSNDYFILFSDGLTEAINPEQELFGENRVKEIILNENYSSPEELKDQLLKQVNDFRMDAEQNDDITMVIVKIN